MSGLAERKSSMRLTNANIESPVVPDLGIRKRNPVTDEVVIQTIEIMKRPGQTLGFYIREGNGIDRSDGIFISRLASGSVIEKTGLLGVGDEILSINKVNVSKTLIDEVVVLMSIPRKIILEVRSNRRYTDDPRVSSGVNPNNKSVVVTKPQSAFPNTENNPRDLRHQQHSHWSESEVGNSPFSNLNLNQSKSARLITSPSYRGVAFETDLNNEDNHNSSFRRRIHQRHLDGKIEGFSRSNNRKHVDYDQSWEQEQLGPSSSFAQPMNSSGHGLCGTEHGCDNNNLNLNCTSQSETLSHNLKPFETQTSAYSDFEAHHTNSLQRRRPNLRYTHDTATITYDHSGKFADTNFKDDVGRMRSEGYLSDSDNMQNPIIGNHIIRPSSNIGRYNKWRTRTDWMSTNQRPKGYCSDGEHCSYEDKNLITTPQRRSQLRTRHLSDNKSFDNDVPSLYPASYSTPVTPMSLRSNKFDAPDTQPYDQQHFNNMNNRNNLNYSGNDLRYPSTSLLMDRHDEGSSGLTNFPQNDLNVVHPLHSGSTSTILSNNRHEEANLYETSGSNIYGPRIVSQQSGLTQKLKNLTLNKPTLPRQCSISNDEQPSGIYSNQPDIPTRSFHPILNSFPNFNHLDQQQPYSSYMTSAAQHYNNSANPTNYIDSGIATLPRGGARASIGLSHPTQRLPHNLHEHHPRGGLMSDSSSHGMMFSPGAPPPVPQNSPQYTEEETKDIGQMTPVPSGQNIPVKNSSQQAIFSRDPRANAFSAHEYSQWMITQHREHHINPVASSHPQQHKYENVNRPYKVSTSDWRGDAETGTRPHASNQNYPYQNYYGASTAGGTPHMRRNLHLSHQRTNHDRIYNDNENIHNYNNYYNNFDDDNEQRYNDSNTAHHYYHRGNDKTVRSDNNREDTTDENIIRLHAQPTRKSLQINTQEFRLYDPNIEQQSSTSSQDNIDANQLDGLSGSGSNTDSRQFELLTGTLGLRIYCARGLKYQNSTNNSLRQLYCSVRVDGVQVARTSNRMGSANIDWDESFHIDLYNASQLKILIFQCSQQTYGKQKLSFQSTMSIHFLTLVATNEGSKLAIILEPKGILYVKCTYRAKLVNFSDDLTTEIVNTNASSGNGTSSTMAASRTPRRDRDTATYRQKLWGESLESVVEREQSGLKVPIIIHQCIVEIEQRGLRTVGLYKSSGNKVTVDELKENFERSLKNVDLSADNIPDIHNIADLLKDYLRSIPGALIPPSLLSSISGALKNPHCNIQKIVSVIDCIGPAHKATLFRILMHLKQVVMRAEINKMTPTVLTSCFVPVLFDSFRKEVTNENRSYVNHEEYEVLKTLLEIWPRDLYAPPKVTWLGLF